MTTKYVLGFVFDTGMRVALIRKDRPEWMAGKWNGIGGKIEANEAPQDAMSREFHEEAGLCFNPADWFKFAEIHDEHSEIYCFSLYVDPQTMDKVATQESEEIVVFNTQDPATIPEDSVVMHNIPWLLPMAMFADPARPPYIITHFTKEQTIG